MSQRNVECVIGRLVTDEEFRSRFAEDPVATLRALAGHGVELTDLEIRALAIIDPEMVESFADVVDPRILKADLKNCGSRSDTVMSETAGRRRSGIGGSSK